MKDRPSPTGRLTRSEPNIQNIPIRTPEGSAIREALLKHLYGEYK